MNFNIPYYMYPNMTPGSQPIAGPSMQPGMAPSVQPLTGPRMQPGMAPSVQPLTGPSMQPGMFPGNLPFGIPFNNFPAMPNETNEMPNMNYPTYQGISNMYFPNENPFGAPMGVPMYPLYGYDSCADLDKDVAYMKQLYPSSTRRIQSEIENECDQMEYDGSVMFDEYPDKIHLERIIDRIYDRVKEFDEEPQLEANSLYFYPQNRRRNVLHDLVTILFLNEIFNRRRHHRSKRRWF
jgi:hypothetical protein